MQNTCSNTSILIKWDTNWLASSRFLESSVTLGEVNFIYSLKLMSIISIYQCFFTFTRVLEVGATSGELANNKSTRGTEGVCISVRP